MGFHEFTSTASYDAHHLNACCTFLSIKRKQLTLKMLCVLLWISLLKIFTPIHSMSDITDWYIKQCDQKFQKCFILQIRLSLEYWNGREYTACAPPLSEDAHIARGNVVRKTFMIIELRFNITRKKIKSFTDGEKVYFHLCTLLAR